jgi:hypothetical protein
MLSYVNPIDAFALASYGDNLAHVQTFIFKALVFGWVNQIN